MAGRGLALTAAGTAIGFAGAWALSELIAKPLFGVSPTEPAIFASAAGIVFLVALAAGYGPARRAARIDPVDGTPLRVIPGWRASQMDLVEAVTGAQCLPQLPVFPSW